MFSPKFGAAAVLDPGFSVSQVAGAVKPKPDYGIYVGPTFKAVNVPGLNLDVKPFFHPFADKFTEVLRRDGLAALLTPEMQRGTLAANDTFADLAKPNPERVTTPAVEGWISNNRPRTATIIGSFSSTPP